MGKYKNKKNSGPFWHVQLKQEKILQEQY